MTASHVPPAVDEALRPLAAVHRLITALQRVTSPGGFYHEAVDAVVTTLGVDRASLLLFDPDGVMRFKAWRGLSDAYRRAVEGHTPWTPGEADAKPILVPDVAADAGLAEYTPTFRAEGIAGLAFIPLVSSGGVVGKFMLYYDEPHDFTPAEVQVAEILAADVALLLERHRSEQAERAARAEADAAHTRLVSLQRVTTELTVAASVDDVAAVVLGTALKEVGARTGSLCLVDGDDLQIAYAVGYPPSVMGHWGRFPLDADLPASDAVRTGRTVFLRTPEERDLRYPVLAASPVVDDQAYAMIPLLQADRPLGCMVVGFAEPRPDLGREEPFFTELAARCAAALERARLFDDRQSALQAEAAARRAAERAQARIASLADASAVLAESLDYDETLHRVAEVVVPRLADGCAVYLKTEEGGIALAALRHRDAGAEARIRALLERFPPMPADPLGPGAVLRTGGTEVYTEVPDEVLDTAAYGGREHVELLRAIGAGAAMFVPLVSRQQTLGVLGLVNDGGHSFEGDVVALAGALAARAATAIDNARLFRDRTAIAQQLRASLLPPQLPDIPAVDLAARYAAAVAGIDVGGDFYDVFPVDARRFVAVLGDVCGRGLRAATLAAHARYTIRSAAVTIAEPAGILAHLNEVLLRRQESGVFEPQFCTALVAVVEPGDGGLTVELAVAGHPLPMHVTAEGAVRPVGVAGSLVGVLGDIACTATTLHLRPAEALVCVTDGVLERRHGKAFFGEEGLAAALAQPPGPSNAEALAAAVERATLDFGPEETTDDFAVLVLRAPAEPA